LVFAIHTGLFGLGSVAPAIRFAQSAPDMTERLNAVTKAGSLGEGLYDERRILVSSRELLNSEMAL
jgi:hypothetical protein